jgi:hypothetical protein
VPAITSHGRRRVAVVELRARAARLIGGAAVGVNDQIAWSPSGWLYFYAGAGRLASYHPGRARAVLLPMRVAPFTKLVAS